MKLLNLALIALLMTVVFLAPACAMELNQDKSISMDDSISIDDAIPSDIPIDEGTSIDDVPSDDRGSHGYILPDDDSSGDDKGSDASVLPDDDSSGDDEGSDIYILPDDDSSGDGGSHGYILPDDVPSDDNESDASVLPDDDSSDNLVPSDGKESNPYVLPDDDSSSGDKGSDANRPTKDIIPSDFNGSEDTPISKEISNSIFDKNSALVNDNCNDNTCSIEDKTNADNNHFDNFNKFHAHKILNDMSYDLFNSYSTFYFDDLMDYEKIIFDTLCCSDSFMGSNFRPFRDDSLMKKTIGLIDLDSSALAINIIGDYTLSLDINTFDNQDYLLKLVSDSIFDDMSIEDSMDNKAMIKDLSSEKSPDLIYFSSDKTFKKCVKTDIFKVSNI